MGARSAFPLTKSTCSDELRDSQSNSSEKLSDFGEEYPVLEILDAFVWGSGGWGPKVLGQSFCLNHIMADDHQVLCQ